MDSYTKNSTIFSSPSVQEISGEHQSRSQGAVFPLFSFKWYRPISHRLYSPKKLVTVHPRSDSPVLTTVLQVTRVTGSVFRIWGSKSKSNPNQILFFTDLIWILIFSVLITMIWIFWGFDLIKIGNPLTNPFYYYYLKKNYGNCQYMSIGMFM